LVTARSIFREFGAKVVVGGKYVIDDYYPERIRKFGLVKEGELAQPDDLSLGNKSYNQNQYVAWHGASNVYHQSGSNAPVYHQPQFESLELKSMKALRSTNYINEENWMHKHAEASSSFNQGLNLKRQDNLQRGFKDVYTGLTFIPNLTQPQHVKFTKVVDSNATDNGKRHRLIYETNISSNNLVKRTGLSSVPLKIFEDCVDEQTLKAILEQQRLEQTQF
jgi:chromatin structure-remodeling complex protein RSC7